MSFNSGQALLPLAMMGTDATLVPIRVTPPPKDLVATATSPLTVAPGGSVSFDIAITNNTSDAASGDLFFTAEQDGNLLAQGVVRSGTVQAGQTVTLSYTQNVPASIPPGDYEYTLNISEDPGVVDDAKLFSLTVTGPARAGGATAWDVVDVTPWTVVETGSETAELPAEAAQVSASVSVYPNPFARQAEIGFSVDEATEVSLVVYDVRDRDRHPAQRRQRRCNQQ